MDCEIATPLLADHAAGRLDAARAAAVAAHLAGCARCRQRAAAEGALDEVLARLPRARAPDGLVARLERLLPATAEAPRSAPPRARLGASSWMPAFASACAAAALVLIVLRTTTPSAPGNTATLVNEVVNDHLRVVINNTHPVEIESGGIHQVKPWFTGRLDFAARVSFSGDQDFPLVGGSLGYVVDRKAAVFSFKRRLHTITLLVFPPEGLPWPAEAGKSVGRLTIAEAHARGFSVLLWRDGGLGYALVSDVNVHDLETLASKMNEE